MGEICNRLHIVILIEALIVAILHDSRLRVGEVVLVFVTGAGFRWLQLPPAGTTLGFASLSFSLAQFGFVLGLFGFIAFSGTLFQHSFGLGQASRPFFGL